MLLVAQVRIRLSLNLSLVANSADKTTKLPISKAATLGDASILRDLVVACEERTICKVFELEVR